MKKNLYKKFQKVDKLKNNYKENFIVEKSQTIKTILSFFNFNFAIDTALTSSFVIGTFPLSNISSGIPADI